MNKSWLQSLTEAYLSEKSLEDLARKHDVSVKSLEKQLEMGIEVEKEHTSDEDKARKIALDHLEEVPEYYSKLKKYVEPKKVDENMSYTNHWTQIIRQLINEGHTKAELMKLSDEKLKDLHKEYSGKDDEESQKEAEMIKDILDSRKEINEENIKNKVKNTVKKLIKKGDKALIRVGKTLIDKQKSDYLSGNSKY